MKIKLLTLLLNIFAISFSLKSQITVRDRWDTLHANVTTVYPDTFYYVQKGVVPHSNFLYIFGDSTDLPNYNRSSYIHRFNITNNTYSKINYPRFITDGGINAAARHLPSNSNFIYFGARTPYSFSLDSTLILYKLNTLNNAVTTETAYTGTGDYREGIYHMCFYSPLTNHDTLLIFNHMGNSYNGDTMNIFKKQVNQTGLINTNIKIPQISEIKTSIVFNNTLYIAGKNTSQESFLLNTTNGINFNFNSGYASTSYTFMPITSMDTLNGYLYIGLDAGDGAYEMIRTSDGINYTQVVPYTSGLPISMKNYKDKLFYVTFTGSRPDVYYLTSNNNTPVMSIDTIGRPYNYAYNFALAVNNNSLFLSGIYDNYIDNHYGEFVYKLIMPVANFSISGTDWCLNKPYTLVNQSTNADSVRWIKDNNYYASTSNTYAAVFNSTGTHTIGLIAITGTQKDTLTYTINVYTYSVSVAGPSNLCINVPTTFTVNTAGAIGPNTYSISPTGLVLNSYGQGSVVLTASASGAVVYEIEVNDANNCNNTSPTYSINVLNNKNIFGAMTHSSNAVAGEVTLYRYVPVLTKFDSITTVIPDALGQFTFTSQKADTYIIKGSPTDNSLQVTYAPNAISWQNATVVSHGCVNSTSQNINVVALANIGSGPGILSGKIVEGQGYGQKGNGTLAPGNPIKGVIIKGGRNPGGDIVAQSRTNAAGEFTLSNLPLNVAGENYFLIVDIPGLDTSSTYYRSVNTGSLQYTNLDFSVDSMMIRPLESVNVNEINLESGTVKIYPNPAQNYIHIECSISVDAEFSIELHDISGRRIKALVSNQHIETTELNQNIDISEIPNGVYILNVMSKGISYKGRLIVTR